jgi:protein-tyrosine phosphatase
MRRKLQIAGAYNVRDLGGYTTGSGAITRWRTLIRAGNLNELDMVARQQVRDLSVTTVLDLRDEWEVESYPHVFANSGDVRYVNLPLIGNAFSQDEAWKAKTHCYESLADLYVIYVEDCRAQIRAIITEIAAHMPGVIFHCHAGKDRTGIIAALLLGAVGVSDEQIAEDYARTNQQITHLVDEWRKYAQQQGSDMQAFERDVAAAPETMIALLDYLKQRYGNVRNYLRDCGVPPESLSRLTVCFM